ncbi:hypothetical protein Lspi_0796 [Legionella spiritensis]|uniref:Uncharacterized protein n=1 Tax=Legionella spiritensis TaxID=452 RepID=A0A0W0Z675_LEGSP|nr:hypothetical protein Lspi_0796 [Legionella spiritensis]SNV47497.1 Uncharacterised protein [Legionella spiritensis]
MRDNLPVLWSTLLGNETRNTTAGLLNELQDFFKKWCKNNFVRRADELLLKIAPISTNGLNAAIFKQHLIKEFIG